MFFYNPWIDNPDKILSMKSKVFLLFSLLLLTVSLTMVSCGDEKEEDNPKPEASLTAKIDGIDWVATETGASYAQNKFNLTGKKGDVILTFTLSNIAESGKGAFPLSTTNVSALYDPTLGVSAFTSNANGGGIGNVTITAVDKQDSTVTGIFSATVINPVNGNTKEISNGKFSHIRYTTTLPETSGNTMSAKVDGTLWEPPRVFGYTVNNRISIYGTTQDGSRSLSVTFSPTIAPGTYSISTFGEVAGSYNPNATTFMGADSGSLTITEHDISGKRITGTFSFEASVLGGTGTASITEGTFSVGYP